MAQTTDPQKLWTSSKRQDQSATAHDQTSSRSLTAALTVRASLCCTCVGALCIHKPTRWHAWVLVWVGGPSARAGGGLTAAWVPAWCAGNMDLLNEDIKESEFGKISKVSGPGDSKVDSVSCCAGAH